MTTAPVTASAAVRAAASAVRSGVTYAGLSARGITARLAAMIVAAVGTGVDVALTAYSTLEFTVGRGVSASRLVIAFKGPGADSGTERSGSSGSAAVKVVAVIKRSALGVVTAAVVKWVSTVPVEAPMAPSPAVAAIPADTEADSEGKVRAAKPDSWVWIPSRPRYDGITVNQPWIVGRNINHSGIGGLNVDVRTLIGDNLLRRVLQIAGSLGFAAHDLNGVHHILLLVVVGVAERRGPGKILVHVSQDRGKCGERLDAWIPGLLVDGLTEVITLQIGIGLHPAIGLDHFIGESGGRQYLRDQRIGIERYGRNQALQLLGTLLRVSRRLLVVLRWRRSLIVLRWRRSLIVLR